MKSNLRRITAAGQRQKKKKKSHPGRSAPLEALARPARQDYLFEVASPHLSQVLAKVRTSLLNWLLFAPATLKSARTAALKCDPSAKCRSWPPLRSLSLSKKKKIIIKCVGGDDRTVLLQVVGRAVIKVSIFSY